jgi:stage II sporulation protein D
VTTLLLATLLSAAPLSVRVLEREHLALVHLESSHLTCDGAPLPGAVDLVPGVRTVDVGERHCAEVLADDAQVEGRWRYAGRLHVTLQGGALRLVNELDVEDYLPSVIEAELGGAKRAALEAQAVVSRTFALASRKRHGADGYDLCDLAHCQVYRGREGTTDAARDAAKKTQGLVLLSGGVALKPTFFHAACGGHTSSARDVFGAEGAGAAVSDVEKGTARCAASPDFAWSFTIERSKLAEALQVADEGAPLEVLRRDEGGRVVELKFFGHRSSGVDFLSRAGRALGWQTLKSARFSVEEVEGQLRVSGTGRGHGVGLCQAGAARLADQAVDAAGILKRYFPDARLAPAP